MMTAVLFRIEENWFVVRREIVLGAYLLESDASKSVLTDEDLKSSKFNFDIPVVFHRAQESKKGRQVLILELQERIFGIYVSEVQLSDVASAKAKGQDFNSHDFSPAIESLPLAPVNSADTAVDLESSLYLLTETKDGKKAFLAQDVLALLNISELKMCQLVDQRMLGFVKIRGLTVPIAQCTTVGDEELLKTSSQVITFLTDQGPVGMPLKRAARVESLHEKDFVNGTYEDKAGDSWEIFDPKSLFDPQKLLNIVKGYNAIFPSADLANREGDKLLEGTYLSFRARETLYIDLPVIEGIVAFQVKEAESLEKEYLEGIFQGEKIQVLNILQRYSNSSVSMGQKNLKVLVLNSSRGRFGVLVEAVLEIVKVNEAKNILLHDFLLKDVSENLRKDVKKFVLTERYMDGASFSLLELDVESLASLLPHEPKTHLAA